MPAAVVRYAGLVNPGLGLPLVLLIIFSALSNDLHQEPHGTSLDYKMGGLESFRSQASDVSVSCITFASLAAASSGFTISGGRSIDGNTHHFAVLKGPRDRP